jgi:hypothetical protein
MKPWSVALAISGLALALTGSLLMVRMCGWLSFGLCLLNLWNGCGERRPHR